MHKLLTVPFGLALLATSTLRAGDLPDPDGKPADMSKPVKVFIMMGQSNMLGMGKIAMGQKAAGKSAETGNDAGKLSKKKASKKAAETDAEKAAAEKTAAKKAAKKAAVDVSGYLEHAVKTEKLYPFMVDDAGNWTERKDVRNVRVMYNKEVEFGLGVYVNEWLTVPAKAKTIGTELSIGHHLGNLFDEPVMLLKSCIGNLGWDLLPPGSEQYEFEQRDKKTGKVTTYVHAGYKDSPVKWEKGTTPERVPWYAGVQYDRDVANAKKVLEDLNTYYPGAKNYEIAGFFWWQGDKDTYSPEHARRYEENLVRLIEALRKEFNAPNAKFVCATLGQTQKGATGPEGDILNGQLAVDGNSGKYPQFKGNVATVYSHPLSLGGASNSHYNGNAKTYMNIGLAMGEAMVELLKGE
jgi:hypothetical protein